MTRLGVGDPGKAPAFRRGEVVRQSGTRRVMRFRDPEPGGRLYYFKVYRYHRLVPMLYNSYRCDRACREFQALLALRRAGLPAPRPVACGAHRTLGLIRSCFLLTEGVEDARDLESFLRDLRVRRGSTEWRQLLTRGLGDLARLVARMHAADFFDRDLHLRNILVCGDPEEPRFWFIDHPKAHSVPRSRPRARRRAVVHDLASLDENAERHLSRTDRLRFFLAYRGHRSADAEDRALLRDVAVEREHLRGRLRRRAMRRTARRASGQPPW